MYIGILPINIRRNLTISDKAKLLYAEITATLDEERNCTLSNEELGQYVGLGADAARGYLYELRDLELICIDGSGKSRIITLPERVVVVEGNVKEKKTQEKKRELSEFICELWNSEMGTRIRPTVKLVNTVTNRAKEVSDDNEVIDAVRNRIKLVNTNPWYETKEGMTHKKNIYLVLRSEEALMKHLSMTFDNPKTDQIKSFRFS
mgnify:CR=1 FL=1